MKLEGMTLEKVGIASSRRAMRVTRMAGYGTVAQSKDGYRKGVRAGWENESAVESRTAIYVRYHQVSDDTRRCLDNVEREVVEMLVDTVVKG